MPGEDYGYKTEEAPVFFDEWKDDIHAADP